MNHGKKFAAIAASVMVLGMLLPASASAEERPSPEAASKVEQNPAVDEAVRFVQDLGDQAVAVVAVQPPRGVVDERHEALKNLIGEGFDLALIGRFVLGHHWRSATKAQRAEFQNLFADHLLNSYAHQLSAYEATTFTIVSTRKVGENDVLVEMQIASSDGPVNAGWRVRPGNGESRIIDVVIDGISMTLSQRKEFGSVANRDGVDGLLAKMRSNTATRAARLENQDTAPESSAKARMLFSMVGSSGMPWEVALSRR